MLDVGGSTTAGWDDIGKALDRAAVTPSALDVLVNLTDLESGDLARATGVAVWRIDHGSASTAFAGLGAIAEGRPVTEARLLEFSGDSIRLLWRGTFPTQAQSPAGQRKMLLNGTVRWFDRSARQRLAEDIRGELGAPSRPAALTVRIALRVAWGVVGSTARLHWEDATRRAQWNIGVAAQPISSFVAGGVPMDVTWLRPPEANGYLADPFGITVDGTSWVLAEQVAFGEHPGRIVAMRLLPNGLLDDPEVIIEEDIHLSYPYLVRDEGSVFCISERSAAGEIALYRAIEFPRRWELSGVLVAGFSGSDSTVFRHDGRWWMLTVDSDARPAIELHAYFSPDLAGPWTPHSLNPVKTDVATARPAGTPFTVDGRLYRPTQDCTFTYGGAVNINLIERLTVERFSETTVGAVGPDAAGPYPDGLHTLCALGEHTIVDGKRWIRRTPMSRLGRRSRARRP